MLLTLAAAILLHLPAATQQCQYRNGYIYECGHNDLSRMAQLRGPLPEGVTVLDISYNRFDELDPAHLSEQFPSVQQLLAVDNRIASLTRSGSTVPWPHLKLLRLSRNRLESIVRDELAFGTGLEILHLDGNRLQSLSGGCFSRCHNLSLLNLAHNSLDYLHSDYFWGLWSLQHLRLSHNQLTGLPSDAFGHLHSLNSLDLGHNRIKSLSASALRGLPNLSALSLAGNQLAELPMDALQSVPVLRHLDASGNHLTHLSTGLVTRLAALESLLLNGSVELRLIDAGAFERLPRLRLLDVSDSPRLVYVSAAAFVDCQSLTELQLSGCPLTIAPLTDWRRSSPMLKTINVGGTMTPDSSGSVIVMDLFPKKIVLSEGHRLKLPCRSYPEGRARWLLPESLRSEGVDGENGGGSSGGDGGGEQRRHLRHHLTVTPRQDLLLHDAFDRLSGVYACVADEGNGTISMSGSSSLAQRREVSISVKRMESQLLLLKITENSIVVTWQHLTNPDDFVLMYRPRSDDDSSYHRVRLRAYMKRYSISSLRPGCAYQLCLALRTYADYQHLHCMLVTTRNGREPDRDSFMFNGRIVLVLVIGIAVSVGVLVACLVACSLSRDKETDAWSQASLAGSRWSDSQPMTFENRAAADDYFGDAGDALDSEAEEEDEDVEDNGARTHRQTEAAAIDGIELRLQATGSHVQHEDEFGERLVTSVMQHQLATASNEACGIGQSGDDRL